MAVLYAMNANLGIFQYDEDGLRHYEDNPSTNPAPEPEFTAEIDGDLEPPPDGSFKVSDYMETVIAAAGVPNALPEPNIYLGEYNSGEVVTEVLGYIPLERRIQDLMRAGKTLGEYREDLYDGHDSDGDDIPLNPLRGPNVDLTDIDTTIKTQQEAILKARTLKNEKEEVVHEEAAKETPVNESGKDGIPPETPNPKKT